MLLGASTVLPAGPLFESADTLEVVIEAPFRELSNRRQEEPEIAGTFRFTEASGAVQALPVTVSTRGKTRLEICNYPPLRLTFDRKDTAGTLLDGQRNLKIVRPCKRGIEGRDWLFLELGAYRAYNAITDYSFRVRQMNVTFRESGARFGRDLEQAAFLLEDDSDVAKRTGRERIRPPEVDLAQMSPSVTTHHMLFQYLIGNTDFSVKRGPSGEGCCHNARVIAESGQQRDWIVVPYDFDYAGIIDADYALPHEALPIKKVTTRLYRGFCWQNDLLPRSIELFNEKRAEIETALIPPEVSGSKSSRVRNFIERFYKIVNDPEEMKRNLLDKCREPDSMPLRERPVSPRHAGSH